MTYGRTRYVVRFTLHSTVSAIPPGLWGLTSECSRPIKWNVNKIKNTAHNSTAGNFLRCHRSTRSEKHGFRLCHCFKHCGFVWLVVCTVMFVFKKMGFKFTSHAGLHVSIMWSGVPDRCILFYKDDVRHTKKKNACTKKLHILVSDFIHPNGARVMKRSMWAVWRTFSIATNF